MAIYRITVLYETVDAEGWSENYYWSGSTLTAAQTEMDSLISDLVALRPSNVKIIDGRVSDVTMRGNTLFTTHTVPLAGTFVPATGANPLEANVALMVRLIAVLPRFARVFLRGLSSDVIKGREYLAPSGWSTALGVLTSRLITGGYQARHRLTPPPHSTYSYSPIATLGNILVGARKPGRPFGLLRGRRTVPE